MIGGRPVLLVVVDTLLLAAMFMSALLATAKL